MVKVVVVIRRIDGMCRETFLRYWQEDLVPYVAALPGVRGYRQSPAIDRSKGWPWDGAAEVWFDDFAAVKAAFASPAGAALNGYEELFMGEKSWFVAEDRPVFGFPDGEPDGVRR